MSVDDFIREFTGWESWFKAATKLPASAPGGSPDKGKVFERLTQLYLRTSPEYQSKLSHVWRAKEELPPDVRAKIRLPPGDEGIDLVAQTFEGHFWSIQCKFRSNTHQPLTAKELSTFTSLSFVNCQNISLAVVVHTCTKPVKKRKLLGRTTEIGLDRWLAIDDELWARMRPRAARKVEPPRPRKPRPHQQAAIRAARDYFSKSKNTRGRLIMPCGTIPASIIRAAAFVKRATSPGCKGRSPVSPCSSAGASSRGSERSSRSCFSQ